MTVQRVDPSALASQAAEMKGQDWDEPADDAVVPPDALPATIDAIANLNDNARSIKEFQRWAEVENQRIAEMLDIAAQAYEKVDADYGAALDNPERAAAVDAISIPAPQTQPPEMPGPAGTPRPLDTSAYSDVKRTQDELAAPDTGASLKQAMWRWGAASSRIEGTRPKPPPGDWEGEAADAAYARMTTFANWLTQLSAAWHDLAEAASKILTAHDKAKSAHDPIYREYTGLEARMRELAGQAGVGSGLAVQMEMDSIRQRMEALQAQSDEVRREYASDATFTPVRPADPPFRPSDSFPPAGGGHGRGGQPTGDPAAMAQKMAESLGTPQSQSEAARGGAAGGSPAGGGGSPPGEGGAGPGPGGSEGGGSPAGSPKLPTDPDLRPAAGNGPGSGSGGGAAGAGAPAGPLSPAVTAETVAPAPPVPVAAGPTTASPAGTAGSGMMGGGMAPMHGGQGGQQGKEKRRDPLLAPDEDLYTEDRPWTEGVVGNRRRKEVGDGKDSVVGRETT